MSIDSNQFSEREKDVVKLLLQGKSNKQIALELGISNRTVEFHLGNIYTKLGVTSRTETFLKLSENHLWKSTGNDKDHNQVKSTVDINSESAENGVKPISRRIPMKNLFYIIGGGLFITLLVGALVLVTPPTKKLALTPTISAEQTSPISTETLLILMPTITPEPSRISTSTPSFFATEPTTLPSATPTPVSPYEADHEEIRKVIGAYFDKVYFMRNSFQVDGFGDTVSTSEEAKGFLRTQLRRQAVEIVWARQNFLRYASYSYTLNYSEIVVFDAGQRARVNFTEGNEIVYELSIPSGIVSQASGIKHIMILKKEQDGWKIVYDVNNDQSHRSLYAPTPFPKDVLDDLDRQLIRSNEGRGGPALPKEGKLFIPSDPAQLEKWKEYESALAEKLMPQYPRDKVLCEWELMEKSEQKINVWAMCLTTVTSPEIGNYYFPAASVPAVINLDAGGGVRSVEIPEYGKNYIADYWKLVPNTIWNQLPNVSAMEKHLHWRQTHPAEPPLVVLNAAAILLATPTAPPAPTATAMEATPIIESNAWISHGLEGETIYSLAIDPVTPTTLYAGVYGGGVFKTTDGGWNWNAVNNGLTSVIVQSLVIDPKTPSTIYAGTGNRGIFKSTDGGGTWNITNVGLKNSTVAALAIDPTTPTTLYAGTSGGGVFKSVDGGVSWSASNVGMTNAFVSALAIDPTMPTTIYAGSLHGVFKSTDGGANWSLGIINPTDIHVVSLAIDPTTPTTIYAGTNSWGVFKSIDGGANWSKSYNGLTWSMDILSLAIDPTMPTIIYAGTFNLGVFKSTDGGKNWSASNTGFTVGTVNALVIDPKTPTTLYAGTWYRGAFVNHLVK